MRGDLLGVLLIMGVATAASQPQPEEAFDLNESGLKASSRGAFVEAEGWYRQSLALWRELGPDYYPHTGTTLYNLGQTLVGQGKWRDSIPVFEESLLLYRLSVGPKNIRTMASLNVLGNVSMVVGDAARAEGLFREALPVERDLYPQDPQLARTLGGLAAVLVREEKVQEALPLADEALSVAIRTLGENDVDTATLYSNVANVHRRAGHPERALPLLRKALAIYDRLLPPSNPLYGSLLSQEGLALMDDGQTRAADRSMTRALELLSQCAPGCNFSLAIAHHNLGLLRLRQGKLADADGQLARALDLEEQYSEKRGSDFVGTLQLLSDVREKERLFDDAAVLRKRAAALQSYR